jgi:hypothetical protein
MGVPYGAVPDPLDPGSARKRFHHGGEGQPPPPNGVAAVMNGSLLISLLPPEPLGEAAKTPPDQEFPNIFFLQPPMKRSPSRETQEGNNHPNRNPISLLEHLMKINPSFVNRINGPWKKGLIGGLMD